MSSNPTTPTNLRKCGRVRFIATVLKTVEQKCSVSSNLTASTNYRSEFATQRKRQRRRDSQGETRAKFKMVDGAGARLRLINSGDWLDGLEREGS